MSRNPNLTLTKSLPKGVDVVVLGLVTINQAGQALVGLVGDLDKACSKIYGRGVADLAAALGASAKREEVTFLPVVDGARVAVVGLGDADVTPAGVRLAVGTALRKIAELPEAQGLDVAVSLELTDPELLRAAGEGALLGAYAFQPITATSKVAAVGSVALVSSLLGAEQKDAVTRAKTTADAVCQARDWGNTPPNLLYPETFAEAARVHVRDERITVDILDDKALERGGYGGIMAVGGGSARGPRLVRLSYAPRGAETHLALVGKGITFDSGGLDIKPAGQMAGMKFDMSGAARLSRRRAPSPPWASRSR